MRVQRTIQKPIKSFYIARRDIDKNDFNIHLFEDKSTGKRVYSFVISKDDKEEFTIVNKQNIIAMLHSENQADVKPLIPCIGNAIRELRKLNREVYDYDLIENIKKATSDFQYNMWENKNATKYYTPAQKAEMAKRPKYQKKNIYGEADADLRATKPIVMIETLERMGVINVIRTEPNGDETKHKIEFTDKARCGNTNFNISVVRHHGLDGNKSEIFKDFYNTNKKGLGIGGLGILTHLGEYGLFGKVDDNETNEQKIDKAKEFFKTQVLPNVNKNDMVYGEVKINRVYLGKSSTFQPVKTENKRVKDIFVDFLNWRMIPNNVIETCFNKDIAFTGGFYVSRIQNEPKENGDGFKENYGYSNQPFFRLRKGEKGFFSGAEMFQIKRSKGAKPFEYDKKNTGAVDGRYFMFGEEKTPKLAIVHEAILDSLSSYVLLDEAGADADAVKYISTQGASHMKKFFAKNMGFITNVHAEISDKDKANRTQAIYFNQTKKDLTPEIIEEYKEKLSNKKFVFFDYGDTSKTMMAKIEMLKPFFKENSFEIIKKSKREDVNFNDYNKDGSLLIDKLNFNEFVSDLKMDFEYDSKNRRSILKTYFEKEKPVNLDDRKKSVIQSRIKKFFGTNDVAFCLDNDHAGLPYMIVFAEMKRHFGVNVSYMIPDDLKYQNSQGLSLKAFVKDFENLCEKGSYDEAYEKVHKYAAQKPVVDNNDVLKHYLGLKAKNPNEAKQFLNHKLEQLGIDKNSDLFPKKKNKRSGQRP